MASVTFDESVGGDGSTITDDANASTGLKQGGHRSRFVPALTQTVAVAQFIVDKAGEASDSADAAAGSAVAAAASAVEAVEVIEGFEADTAAAIEAAAVAVSEADRATDAANAAEGSKEIYASTADALSNGVYSLDSLVVGSGGTDGTFAVAFTGGAGSGAAGWFTVVSGAISAYEITARGRGYTSAPTVSFSASSGLSGASATAVIAANRSVGQRFKIESPDAAAIYDEYIVIAGPDVQYTGKSLVSVAAMSALEDVILNQDQEILNVSERAETAFAGMHKADDYESGVVLAGVTSPAGETQVVVEYQLAERALKVNGAKVPSESDLGRRLVEMQFVETSDQSIPLAGVTDVEGAVQVVVEYSVEEKALKVNGTKLESAGGYSEMQLAPLAEAERYTLRDINHVIYYGQSLSNGTVSSPLISTVSRFSNAITFSPGGPRATLAGSVGLNPGMDALGPLIENDKINDNGDGHARLETPCSGTINSLIERMAKEDGTDWRTADEWMCSAAGKGSASITQLSPGELAYIPGAAEEGEVEWFQVFRDHVDQAKSLADAASKTYAVPAVVWMQGEGDNAGFATADEYYDALSDLRDACNTYVKSVTGQAEDIVWLMYQTYGRTANEPLPSASIAQLRYAREVPLTYIVNPVGRFPRAYDNGHLSGVGSYWFGYYAGRLLKRLLVDHLEPTWLYPLSATAIGREVTVRFNVPVAPLLLDDTSPQMYVTTDYGFAVNDTTGTPSLSDVRVGVDGRSVVFDVDRDLGEDAVVRYGLDYLGAGEPDYSGSANGNLRDSNKETLFLLGEAYATWATSVHFEMLIVPLEVLS
ncbi:hypothetical protein [uncultured Zhongshania sp.]|uniref:hypothetical protein n=1 Tax=uncultured Zhongshania sp. TaxID=1642288 RepID=UPI0030D926B8